MTKLFALAALAIGLLSGIAVAALVPKSSGSSATVPIKVLPPNKTVRDSGQVQIVPEAGSPKIELRRDDPRGGPPFALRVFRARRLALPPGGHDINHARLLGHSLCAQLGRIYRGKFGWLDARNQFREAAYDYQSTPMLCGDRWRDERSAPQLSLTTLITDPVAQSAAPVQAIAWGIAGSLADGVTIDGIADDEAHPQVSRRGAFLAFADRHARAAELKATIDYRTRPTVATTFSPGYGRPMSGPHGPVMDRIVGGSARVEARAADPAGGLPWAVTAGRTKSGQWCSSQNPGRLVGDRVGIVFFSLGTFADSVEMTQCFDTTRFLSGERPVSIGNGGLGDIPSRLSPTAEPREGRTRLRTLPGRSYVTGVALPEVREVTIESPRDVRTVIPSPNAHVFLVVYDGLFPTGDFVVTSTLGDGSHVTQKVSAGGF